MYFYKFQIVKTINWSSDKSQTGSKVKVKCQDGDTYTADHVIVTPSLGFLKENLSIFEPPLPEQYQTAIQKHGFGTLGKMFLIWDSEPVKNTKTGLRKLLDFKNWFERIFGSYQGGMIPMWGVRNGKGAPVFKSAVYRTPLSVRISYNLIKFTKICFIVLSSGFDSFHL